MRHLVITQPGEHIRVIRCYTGADIDELQHSRERGILLKIRLRQRRPAFFVRKRALGVAVARQVDKKQLTVDIIIIDRNRLARLAGNPRQLFASKQAVDQ